MMLQPHETLPAYIKTAENYELSDQDIVKCCDGKVRIVLYKELEDLYNEDGGLDSIFTEEYNYTAALFYTFQTSRHWVALVYHPDEKILYYYGSYGLLPDFEIDISCNEPDAYLSKLFDRFLDQHGVHVIVNQVQMQKQRNSVNTCGRYTALRCLMYQMDNNTFNQFLNSKMKLENSDELVSLLTFSSVYWNDADE